MKTTYSSPSFLALILAGCSLLTFAAAASAQTSGTYSNTVPVVTIYATDSMATWSGDPGVFTVVRKGDPTVALNVYCCIGGTATNGLDYQSIGNTVSLPSGVLSNTIVINPINLGQTNVRSVVVDLCPPPYMTPINYYIGSPSHAVIYIAPTNRVSPPPPPVVRITSPPNGAVFRAPVNLPVCAYAAEPNGTITAVQFFAGGNSIGFGQQMTNPPSPYGGISTTCTVPPTNNWCLVWTNAPLGTNIPLTAIAVDNLGASITSAPVVISVLPPLPPPTNRPTVVSIVAVDPVAIEGTNCWTWLCPTNPNPTWSNWSASLCRVLTNCGPKNATFDVRRYGDTNGDLTVSYGIGGTATNGVDYVTLPGGVTIPSGQRHALITLVPIDDGPPDVSSTVILKLAPSTNYVVGLPGSAAAIILDGPWPRPVSSVLGGHCFHLAATGPDGAWFCVQYSVDMRKWSSLCTNQVVQGSVDFVDPDATGDAGRFYRVVPLYGTPAP